MLLSHVLDSYLERCFSCIIGRHQLLFYTSKRLSVDFLVCLVFSIKVLFAS